MIKSEQADTERVEGRALLVGMWGNLFMGAIGVLAAVLSNSQAILFDGLFSLIGFTAALLGRRISRRVDAAPDRVRPNGYAADEAIFSTFRALSLLGLVFFAIAGAGMNILAYLRDGEVRELHFAPMVIYFAIVGFTCGLLWFLHSRAWRRSGRRSDILRLEATAAAFDGFITAAAGVGLLAIFYLKDSALAPVVPIGDSIVVIILCSTVITRYFRDLMDGLGELAGVTARPEHVAAFRRALRPTLARAGGTTRDLSVTKLGRRFEVIIYLDPGTAIDAAEVDSLTLQLEQDANAVQRGTTVYVIISRHGRALPADL